MYVINKKILHTPVEDGKILLLEPETGMYFEMNDTSVFIYQSIEAGLNKQQILVKMLEKYSINEHQAVTDLDSHIDQLLKQNIINQA